jgi:hypothetical protein
LEKGQSERKENKPEIKKGIVFGTLFGEFENKFYVEIENDGTIIRWEPLKNKKV